VSDAVKVRYEVDLSSGIPDLELPVLEIRALIPTDRQALARLMLDAYLETIDYEGETLTEAIEEVDSWLAGTPMLDHSYAAVDDGRLVSAVLFMVVDGAPLIRSAMTDPDHKGQRIGRAVTRAALESLRATDYPFAALYITKGNTPSERMFASLGAKPTATSCVGSSSPHHGRGGTKSRTTR
jgi:ribosomal protein S18 acetylase RimI-like enzyme